MKKRPPMDNSKPCLETLIGNTPLIYLRSISETTGCHVYAKAEFMSPGGSVKDRIALEIIKEAMERNELDPGALICEGTAGSTGVSLAMVARAHGLRCFVALPDDAAIEKAQLLQALGAEVERVRPVSIANPGHHVNVARRRAEKERENRGSSKAALFADQFENEGNFRAHLKTGEEIWDQTGGKIDAFVSGAGTGGTIAGCSQSLKDRDPSILVYLIDPPGSSLYNKITRGVLYTSEEKEGHRLKNPFDTITEGIGLNRLTRNFSLALIDGAFQGSDREAVEMAAYLVRNEGLFVGSSAVSRLNDPFLLFVLIIYL